MRACTCAAPQSHYREHMLFRRFTVRAEKSPSTEDIALIVQGKQPLPWDADGFAPVDDLKCVARDFCERFFEWERAAEEQEIVQQEVVDSTQFYRGREDRILGLVRSVAQGQVATAEHGRLFFLLRFGEGVVDVHLRMLQLAHRLDMVAKCAAVNTELLAWLQSCQAHQCVRGEPAGGLSDDDIDDLGFVESEADSEVEDEL